MEEGAERALDALSTNAITTLGCSGFILKCKRMKVGMEQ